MHYNSNFESSNSKYFIPKTACPVTKKMATLVGYSQTLGSMYNRYNLTISTNNTNKLIKKIGLFKFEEDLDITPWHLPSLLNFTHTRVPLPKFKDHLTKFSRNETCTIEAHFNAFFNACHNIGTNANVYACVCF